ncbi:hypothetical protein ACFC60_26335 [Kitasatospora purpeofusca]|uniref:hypothetical protein n=1 Tax=Kitasatospora purpeofusca TaxID=67352 RepID=UPI0035DF593D
MGLGAEQRRVPAPEPVPGQLSFDEVLAQKTAERLAEDLREEGLRAEELSAEGLKYFTDRAEAAVGEDADRVYRASERGRADFLTGLTEQERAQYTKDQAEAKQRIDARAEVLREIVQQIQDQSFADENTFEDYVRTIPTVRRENTLPLFSRALYKIEISKAELPDIRYRP